MAVAPAAAAAAAATRFTMLRLLLSSGHSGLAWSRRIATPTSAFGTSVRERGGGSGRRGVQEKKVSSTVGTPRREHNAHNM